MDGYDVVHIRESGGTMCKSIEDAKQTAVDMGEGRAYDAIIRDDSTPNGEPVLLYLDGRWYKVTPS